MTVGTWLDWKRQETHSTEDRTKNCVYRLFHVDYFIYNGRIGYGKFDTNRVMVVSPQSPAADAQSVQARKINMASKQTSVADTRTELAELVKRKAEVAVSTHPVHTIKQVKRVK